MTLPAEVIKRVEAAIADLDAAATPTKSEVFVVCGPTARTLAADLRLLLEEVGGGWRPIETAPKDGTRVLVAGPYHDGTWYMHAVRWGSDSEGPDDEDDLTWGWCVFIGEPCNWRPEPTLWKPISPPSNQEGGEG